MKEKENKESNILSENQENILKQEIKFIQEEFKNKIKKYRQLKDELKNIKISFHNGLNDYKTQKNLTIEKEQEIESLLSKISKMKKMMLLTINQSINKKFYTYLLEISNNRQNEIILLKFFNFFFNIYNFSKIYLNNSLLNHAPDRIYKNNSINKNDNDFPNKVINMNNFSEKNQSTQELLMIIKNENEIKNILCYSYDIFYNLQKENEDIYINIKNSYFELFNEITNIEKQYPFDLLFDFVKNNFTVIENEKKVEELKKLLNKLMQEKNAKFVEVKNIESIIKTYNRNIKIISNYIKALKNFYYRIKEKNDNQNINGNINKNSNDIMKGLIDDIEKFKRITIDYDKINSNFDAMTSLSFGTNYTLSEKSSIKSSIIDSKNNNIDNENNNDNNIVKNKDINNNTNIKKQDNNNNNINIIKKNNIDINDKSIKKINFINKIQKNSTEIKYKNKKINKNNNINIGKRNNKTLKKNNISLSKMSKIKNSTSINNIIKNKNLTQKEIKAKSFKTYDNKRNPFEKDTISFNKEYKNNKNILNNSNQNKDKKIFKTKLKKQKILNKENLVSIGINNNSYNLTNNNKNKKLSHNKSTENNKKHSQILEKKNNDSNEKNKEKNKIKIEMDENYNNNNISSPKHTTTLKLYNLSEKKTEKEFEKPFLLNSNQKTFFVGNNRYNISKKIEKLKQKETEESIEITISNKENNLNEDFFDQNNIKDSICDEMIAQNFGTANSLIRSTTNDYINRLGFKNNVLWSENLYKSKVMKFKSNFKKLKIEKPIDASSCCASCT